SFAELQHYYEDGSPLMKELFQKFLRDNPKLITDARARPPMKMHD
ncbi:MAG: hypothetical protein Harvfovirus41_1, partial [Harvfovirus sp.]